MISRVIKKTIDLNRIQKVDQLEGPLYQLEDGGHTFEITCLMDGAAAAVSGTVSARFLRADETTVYFTGTLSGNVASVTLPQSCYNGNGRFGMVVFISGDDITTAVYAVAGSVYRSTSDTIIDPTEEIPSLEELIAQIEACEAATALANAAAAFVPNVIAPDYSNLTFPVTTGSPCTKDGYYYVANTDIASSETWTAAHWTQVTAGGELGDLKSAFETLDADVDGDYTKNYTTGKNLTASSASHSIIDDSNACISDVIPLTWTWDADTYQKFWYTDSTTDTNSYFIFFYDSNNNFLGYRGHQSGLVARSVKGYSGAAYVQFSFKKGFAGKLTDALTTTVDTYWIAQDTLITAGLKQKVGNLSNLTTTNKNSLVEAINEVSAESASSSFEEGTITDTYNYKNSDIEWTAGVKYYNGTHYTGGTYDNYHFCYFDVQKGDVIVTAQGSFRDRCEFLNNVVVSSTNVTGFSSYTVPDGVDKVALTRAIENTSNIVLYRQRDTMFVKEESLTKNVGSALADSTSLLDDVIINLPSKIYALIGFELNIYFENLVEDWTKYIWKVSCSKGMQLERGYRITPTNNDAGTYTLTITISSGKSTKTASASLIVTALSAGSGATKKVIILGDSTTYNGTVISKLNENFTGDVMTISTIGTMGTAPNNHEGRSGWTLNDYFTKASITYPSGDPRGTIYNPFYNPSTHTFDASYYFTNSGIAQPDWFIINMGINDMFGMTTDAALDSQIDTCIGYLNSMIDSIQGVSASIKIGVCVTIPPNHSQDAFGKAYACSQTRDRYKRNNAFWADAIISEFDEQESNGVYIIPIHTNLDTVYNMGMETLPVNARNTAMTYESPIGNGGVHPVESGYWQIADVYTAFLKGNA